MFFFKFIYLQIIYTYLQIILQDIKNRLEINSECQTNYHSRYRENIRQLSCLLSEINSIVSSKLILWIWIVFDVFDPLFCAAQTLYDYILYIFNQCMLKDLEHRKLGWKVLNLKYDLGKSLSKKLWCKMADTKNILTTYFKR